MIIIIIFFGIILWLLLSQQHYYKPKKIKNVSIQNESKITNITSWDNNNDIIVGNLPDGRQVFSCEPDDGRTFPVSWPYKNISKGILTETIILPIEVKNKITIKGGIDELLWIGGLNPNKPYVISIDDRQFDYISNEQGNIFLADSPFPLSAIPYSNVIMYIPEGSFPISGSKLSFVHSTFDIKPEDNYVSVFVKNEGGHKSINLIRRNILLMKDCGYYEKPPIVSVGTVLSNSERSNLGKTPLNMNLLTKDGIVPITINDGKIFFK